MNIQSVKDLKKFLSDTLSSLENVGDDVPVDGVTRLDLKVCNIDGYDVNHPEEEDKVVDFVRVEVVLSRD